jgi:hypothetical protein
MSRKKLLKLQLRVREWWIRIKGSVAGGEHTHEAINQKLIR